MPSRDRHSYNRAWLAANDANGELDIEIDRHFCACGHLKVSHSDAFDRCMWGDCSCRRFESRRGREREMSVSAERTRWDSLW